MKDKIQINISEELKTFFWTPMKTSSMHSTMVFTLFGFEYFFCSQDRKEVYIHDEFPKHLNSCDLFLGHENYTLICTARNPLHRIFSAYLFFNKNKPISVQGFREYFSFELSKPNNNLIHQKIYDERIADYYVRVENLYEDYLNIPFIRDSKLVSSGALKELCDRKKNYSTNVLNIKNFYTSDMIEFVYENNKEYFNFLGYEPVL